MSAFCIQVKLWVSLSFCCSGTWVEMSILLYYDIVHVQKQNLRQKGWQSDSVIGAIDTLMNLLDWIWHCRNWSKHWLLIRFLVQNNWQMLLPTTLRPLMQASQSAFRHNGNTFAVLSQAYHWQSQQHLSWSKKPQTNNLLALVMVVNKMENSTPPFPTTQVSTSDHPSSPPSHSADQAENVDVTSPMPEKPMEAGLNKDKQIESRLELMMVSVMTIPMRLSPAEWQQQNLQTPMTKKKIIIWLAHLLTRKSYLSATT